MLIMDFPNAVTSRSAFYNRREALEKALRVILAGKRVPVVVIGERRIGKTSFHNVVMEMICQENPAYVMLQVEPRGNATVDLFAEAVLRQMTMHLKRDLHDTGLYTAERHFHLDAPDQFDLAVRRILPDGWRGQFVLCIDEFDEIVRLTTKTGETEKERLFDLIHHLVERSSLPLTLFFTMTRVPDPLKREVPSPLMGKSEIVELAPLPHPATLDMIDWLLKDTKITIQPAAKERMAELAGGHPYFIKLLVSNLSSPIQNQDEATIDLIEFEQAVLPRALDDPRARYAIENIYKAQHFSPDEKSVLLYLAERGEPVEMAEFRMAGREVMHAVNSLTARNYLFKQENRYTIRIRFLEHWFRNWAEFEEELERLNVHHLVGLGINAVNEDL